MNNRFTITEEEKNRIRGLHRNHSIIKEQSEERKKISMEDYRSIMNNLKSKMENMLRGKTVNLWTTTSALDTYSDESTLKADGPGAVEGDEVNSLGSWTITNVEPYSELDEESGGEEVGLINIQFKPRRGPEDKSQEDMVMKLIDGLISKSNGRLSTMWGCGDKTFYDGTITNLKLIDNLNSELCNSIEWKEYDKLFSPNGNYVVTDMDVDFSMGDEDMETLA